MSRVHRYAKTKLHLKVINDFKKGLCKQPSFTTSKRALVTFYPSDDMCRVLRIQLFKPNERRLIRNDIYGVVKKGNYHKVTVASAVYYMQMNSVK